jgi:hypothetical protein
MTCRRSIFAGLVIMAVAALPLRGQPPQPEPELKPVDKQQIEAALKLTTAEAAKYTFTIDGKNSKPELRAEPLLRWSNPVVGEVHGYVYLWTLDERPVVIGSLFKWFTPHTHMSHEFHSLAEGPLRGSYDGAAKWTTKTGGVSFAPLPEAPAPAANANQRLLQMKRLAKDFAATKNERDGAKQELRLLPQPIYRYSALGEQIVDAGLFAFVQGTDPEVFLLLEARGDEKSSRWNFAAARMNGVGFDLHYQDKMIWQVEVMPWRDIGDHAQAYTSFFFKMP